MHDNYKRPCISSSKRSSFNFMMGLRGFANDKKGKKITPTNFKNNNKKKKKENNVIDFIDYLKNKRILNQ